MAGLTDVSYDVMYDSSILLYTSVASDTLWTLKREAIWWIIMTMEQTFLMGTANGAQMSYESNSSILGYFCTLMVVIIMSCCLVLMSWKLYWIKQRKCFAWLCAVRTSSWLKKSNGLFAIQSCWSWWIQWRKHCDVDQWSEGWTRLFQSTV